MKLPEISIQRPVFATMMNLALVIFGIVALTRLLRVLQRGERDLVELPRIELRLGDHAENVRHAGKEPLRAGVADVGRPRTAALRGQLVHGRAVGAVPVRGGRGGSEQGGHVESPVRWC